jgi:hypothetical protein
MCQWFTERLRGAVFHTYKVLLKARPAYMGQSLSNKGFNLNNLNMDNCIRLFISRGSSLSNLHICTRDFNLSKANFLTSTRLLTSRGFSLIISNRYIYILLQHISRLLDKHTKRQQVLERPISHNADVVRRI